MGDPFRFVVLAKIASGGTATVYVGSRGHGRNVPLVALKRPHPHVLDDDGQRATLLREARVASELHHANLVEVREIEIVGDALQLVMDYVEGAALGTLIASAARADERLPPSVAVRIVLDACAGLEAVHEKRDAAGALLGLVHRDVSPQNILVGTDGVARVTDFGLAKAVYEGAPSTTQGTLKGKLGYMAPEYVSRGHLDRAVDVFASGVVLWEALAGRRLFRGDNEAQTLDRVLREAAPKLADIDPALGAVDAVVAQALAKDPKKRFSSTRTFADALLDAANASFGVASYEQVGACVTRLAGAELADRRATLALAVRTRSRRSMARAGGAALAVVAGLAAIGVVAKASRAHPPSLTLRDADVPTATTSVESPPASRDPATIDVRDLPIATGTSVRAPSPHRAGSPALPPNPYMHKAAPH